MPGGRTVKKVSRMSGHTNRPVDLKRVALTPGKRLSEHNKTYWETRMNRADMDRKKRF